MEKKDINWNMVEEIAEAIFPDEYELVTRRQLKDLEMRISEGLQPVEPDRESGGLHQYFGAALENIGNILTAISIVVTWYTWSHPKEQKINYSAFLDYLSENPEARRFFNEELDKREKKRIEKDFDSTIAAKLEELSNEGCKSNH